MKKVSMEPVTQVTDEMRMIVAEFGDVEMLGEVEARAGIEEFDERVAAQSERIVRLAEFARGLMSHQRRWKGTRKYHIYICLGCGDPMLVSSGPRFKPDEWVWETDAKKSTLIGGCVVCEQPMTTSDGKPQRRGGTLKWAKHVAEVKDG